MPTRTTDCNDTHSLCTLVLRLSFSHTLSDANKLSVFNWIAQDVRKMPDAARASRIVQRSGVHQHAPIIVRRVLICSNERIHDGVGVVPSGGHIMTGATATANALAQH
eukprot:8023069-Pyramimonas_sp.AAC.1